MLLSAAPRRDTDARCSRDRAAEPDAAERLRSVRERLEATVSGLGELEFLRQRQEVLVRAALEHRQAEAELSSEEKLLEENILLLRKQLNCLRRRDAGLISQLQELDRQICDLHLDTEMARDQLETDSRPSSGFFELSDGASGSLSNLSNSVFSECWCSAADADGRLRSTDELFSCLECDGLLGGLCDDSSSSATVRRSLSPPHPPTLDSVSSCDVYRYPSPLHAVAVQSQVLLQTLGHGSHSRNEELLKSLEAPLMSQGSSWPESSLSPFCRTLPHKRLDSYIYGLLQRRALPIRTSKPRTSISTDPSKSILRQTSLCVRQVSGSSSGSGLGPLTGSELKSSSAEEANGSPPQRQWSRECKCKEQEVHSVLPGGGDDMMQTGFKIHNSEPQNQNSSSLCNAIQNVRFVITADIHTGTNSLLKRKTKEQRPHSTGSTGTLPKDSGQLENPRPKSTLNEIKQPGCPSDQNLLIKLPSTVDMQSTTLGSSSQSQDEGGSASHIHQLHKGGSKTVKGKTSRAFEPNEPTLERQGDKSYHRSSSKKSRLLESGGSTRQKVFKKIAASAPGVSSIKIKRLPPSIPEGRVLDKQTPLTFSASRHHHKNHHHHHGNFLHYLHGRDQVIVVAKPKHKRNDYQRFRAILEVPHDEAFRRPHPRQRKVLVSKAAHLSGGQTGSSCSYEGGSDSEYSAECASLFHSTIADTSEDEKSNYTTNCFGDSESSQDEYIEEGSTTSDTEKSAGGRTGGRSRPRNQLGSPEARAAGRETTSAQAKAFVKIKASHNLKRKIMRFRSGSLKLMTTV